MKNMHMWTIETTSINMLVVFAENRENAIKYGQKKCRVNGLEYVEAWLGYKWQNDLGKEVL